MNTACQPSLPSLGSSVALVYQSLKDQLSEAVQAAGFTDVVIGLSGGIDSALVTTLAVDALGASHTHVVVMPSPYTPSASTEDAALLASNVGVALLTVAIDSILAAYDMALEPLLAGTESTITRENLQARIRATLLMAFSNQNDWLVLSTGNRSESLVGYTTLYGDMVGAFAPIAPLYKGWVYELARYRNSVDAVIPQRILTKAPSAELSPGQTDEAHLGSYEQLDAILYALDNGSTIEEIIEKSHSRDYVERIEEMIEKARFKQRYMALGAQLPDLPETASDTTNSPACEQSAETSIHGMSEVIC